MRIHTSLDTDVFYDAAKVAGVSMLRFTTHGSRSHEKAYDVVLTGDSPYRTQMDRDEYAASWDQWGIFLNYLFDKDYELNNGCSMKATYYKDYNDFRLKTGSRFDSLVLADAKRLHNWNYSADLGNWCKCGATRRW